MATLSPIFFSCTPIPDVPQIFLGDKAAKEEETDEIEDLQEASGECQRPLSLSLADGVEAAEAAPGERGVCMCTRQR